MTMSKLALYVADNGATLTYPFRECDTPPGSVTGAHGRYELKAVLSETPHVEPAPLTRAEVVRIEDARRARAARVLSWTTRTVEGLGGSAA